MPNIRPLNQKKYDMSKNRFMELHYWCLQYEEWKEELKNKTDTLSSARLTGMPSPGGKTDPTQRLAVRRTQLEENCRLIENTAKEIDPDLAPFLVKGATDEKANFNYLKMILDMPCGRDMYYDRRRKFYWLLEKKKRDLDILPGVKYI